VPTFAVDDGFSYLVPESLSVDVGSIVRVPLGGRRVRGWVTGLRSGDAAGLKDIIGVSGAHPIFTPDLLQTLRWASVHYVAPLATVLPKAGPPNLPKSGRRRLEPVEHGTGGPAHLGLVAEALRRGDRPPSAFVPGTGPWIETLAALAAAAFASDRSVQIVVPTAADCTFLTERLSALFAQRVVSATSSAPAAERTESWSQARRQPGTMLIGTAETALWPMAATALAVVVEPGRRAMKAKQTPTVHVRELLRRRAAVEHWSLLLLGNFPTLETAAAGTQVLAPPGRVWPLVEVLDRNQEPPSSDPLARGTRAAISGAVRRGEPVFVFVSRRGYSSALRCTSCGELRRCSQCGSNPGPGAACERCGHDNEPCTACGGATFVPVGAGFGRVLDELRTSLGPGVTPVGDSGQVQVGTERDIPAAATVGLAVVVDIDSMLLRPHYRAEEDTLRVVARVAGTVRRGRGHRCLIQTRLPDHRVLDALRHGSAESITREWLTEREEDQLPPFGELLAIEVVGEPDQVTEELGELAGGAVAVFGPGESGERHRWLVQSPNLRRFKVNLRRHVQSWRDRGLRVRVDADPLDV